MNLEIILKNKKVFIFFLLISFSGGIIESFIRKVNYRVEMGYAYNNAPIGAILNCENDGSVSTRDRKSVV